ncbi:MAG: hypothetical protein EZS28_006828 [Streblomastix strix]|uniref:Uncharacterized protein n=1 Tax=Streblomastix strix TaxID=222440 RepID=A0A5J4WR92_9EUKA|nr:MAG: hypothetical protein EZS28_006828 [Streblomastix strix]
MFWCGWQRDSTTADVNANTAFAHVTQKKFNSTLTLNLKDHLRQKSLTLFRNDKIQHQLRRSNALSDDQNIQYNRIQQLIASVYVTVSSKIWLSFVLTLMSTNYLYEARTIPTNSSIPIPGDDSPTKIPEYYRNLYNINPDIPESKPLIRRLDPHLLLNMNVIYGLTVLKNSYRCQIQPKSVIVFVAGFLSRLRYPQVIPFTSALFNQFVQFG